MGSFFRCWSFSHCLYDNKKEVDQELWGVYTVSVVKLSGRGFVINGATLSSFSLVWSLQTSTYLFSLDLLQGEVVVDYLDGPVSVIIHIIVVTLWTNEKVPECDKMSSLGELVRTESHLKLKYWETLFVC